MNVCVFLRLRYGHRHQIRSSSSRCPELAPLRHADCIGKCPLSGATRKTFAHIEFFSV